MKNTFVQPYVFFGGRCEEAIEFYKKAIDAQVDMLMHFNDSPEPLPPGLVPEGFEGKVMHATFRIGDSTINASDGGEESSTIGGFALSLSLPTEAEAKTVYAPFRKGGKQACR
jgi:PhnB protein